MRPRMPWKRRSEHSAYTPQALKAPETTLTTREVQVIELPEIMTGITLASLIEDCMTNPDRSMPSQGVFWRDKVLSLPNVSPLTHISVGSVDDQPREVDINQSENPFTPAKITYTLGDDQLVLRHNEVADEGGTTETFAPDELPYLEARVTQLFQRYFIRD